MSRCAVKDIVLECLCFSWPCINHLVAVPFSSHGKTSYNWFKFTIKHSGASDLHFSFLSFELCKQTSEQIQIKSKGEEVIVK